MDWEVAVAGMEGAAVVTATVAVAKGVVWGMGRQVEGVAVAVQMEEGATAEEATLVVAVMAVVACSAEENLVVAVTLSLAVDSDRD